MSTDDGYGPVRQRRRAPTLLVAGVVLIAAAAGLAAGLSGAGTSSSSGTSTVSTPPSAPHVTVSSPDQQVADSVQLTRADLPSGWTVSSNTAVPARDHAAQSGIVTEFARCLGVSVQQALQLLLGNGTDQTAESSSPTFVGPVAADSGTSVELVTSAAVVRTQQDERSDFAGFALPGFPRCSAAAIAAELQLGVDDASGGRFHPGPATATALALPSAGAVQTLGQLVDFTVSDGTGSIPVEVETVVLGTDRIVAQYQACAIGGHLAPGIVSSSLSTFELRVAGGGRGVTV